MPSGGPPYIVAIDWSKRYRIRQLDEMAKYREKGQVFYLLLVREKDRLGKPGQRALYVGYSGRHPLTRLAEGHRGFVRSLIDVQKHLKSPRLYVKFGKVSLCDFKRKRSTFLKEVESALIRRHDPIHNTKSTKSYGGRYIIVVNRGNHAPLKRLVEIRGGMAHALYDMHD